MCINRLVSLLALLLLVATISATPLIAADSGGDEKAVVLKKAVRELNNVEELRQDAQTKMNAGRARDAIALIGLAMEKLTKITTELKAAGITAENSQIADAILKLQERVSVSKYEFSKRETMMNDDKRQKMETRKDPQRPLASPERSNSISVVTKKRKTPPSADEIKNCLAQLKDVFATEYAKKTPQGQLQLAQKLSALANENKTDATMRYTLLAEARDAALRAGDITGGFRQITTLANEYEFDVKAMTAKALEEAMKQKTKFSKIYANLTEGFLVFAKKNAADGNFPLAFSTLNNAAKVAAKSRDAEQIAAVRKIRKYINTQRKLFSKIIPQIKILKKSPANQEANLSVGKYYALSAANWRKGIPYLAKGTDGNLAQLAQLEIDRPTQPESFLEIGDAWWTLAGKEPIPLNKANIREHAGYWYRKALPGLKGFALAKANKRLESISQTGKSSTTSKRTKKTVGENAKLIATKSFKISWKAGGKKKKVTKNFTLRRAVFSPGNDGLTTNGRSYDSNWGVTSKWLIGDFKLTAQGRSRSDSERISLFLGNKEILNRMIRRTGWKAVVKRKGTKITITWLGRKSKVTVSNAPGKIAISVRGGDVFWSGDQPGLISKIYLSGKRVE